MEHCDGCNRDVEIVIPLDSHCNLSYCEDCIIGLENNHGEGKMYEEKFENPDKRMCDRCGHMLLNYYLMKHQGKHRYDCVFCKRCIDLFRELIQYLKN